MMVIQIKKITNQLFFFYMVGRWYIGLRPANRYVFSMTVTLEERKPVVVFDLPWHHPSNFHSDSFRLAAARLEFLHERHEIYTLAEGKPPAYYFAADSGVDIYQWAEERSQEL